MASLKTLDFIEIKILYEPFTEVVMNVEGTARTIPLPKNWSQRVRSAVLQALSLVSSATSTRQGYRANSTLTGVRQEARIEAQEDEITLLREEMSIRDARMAQIPAAKRPHYVPTERMRILELRAVRRWSLAETARRFMVEPETISEWMRRINEPGNHALVKIPVPINKYPSYIRYMVQRVRQLCPSMGKKQIAQFFARAGLHVGVSSVGRIIKESPRTDDSTRATSTTEEQPAGATAVNRVVSARYPHHLWHVDLTTVPTCLGWWLAWLPFSLPQMWPFGWYVLVVVDHFSRQVVGLEGFKQEPTSRQARQFLGSLIARIGQTPKHLVADHGPQFDCEGFKAWCKRRKIRPRYGAVGHYGSIAVVERFIRSMKEGWLRIVSVPYRRPDMRQVLNVYAAWYNEHRPHQARGGRTPMDVARSVIPVSDRPRYEPRPGCLKTGSTMGQPGDRIELRVISFQGHRQLPVIELKLAA